MLSIAVLVIDCFVCTDLNLDFEEHDRMTLKLLDEKLQRVGPNFFAYLDANKDHGLTEAEMLPRFEALEQSLMEGPLVCTDWAPLHRCEAVGGGQVRASGAAERWHGAHDVFPRQRHQQGRRGGVERVYEPADAHNDGAHVARHTESVPGDRQGARESEAGEEEEEEKQAGKRQQRRNRRRRTYGEREGGVVERMVL